MRLVFPPGVFRPLTDTWQLADALRAEGLAPGFAALDLCTGSGAVAVSAGLAGAGRVVAVDVSRRAVATARLNGRLNGVRIDARRGDLLHAVTGERFDAIVSNAPYVPAATDELPTRGPRRGWDAGRDGRAVLDRICADAPAHLRPGGVVLLIHSELNGIEQTLQLLRAGGLEADVAARHHGPLGRLMSERAEMLEARGMLEAGRRDEDVVIVRGRAPAGDRVAV